MIKFVYFDVGGVVVLDFSGTNKWIQLQEELGITHDRKEEFFKFWEKYESYICISLDMEKLLTFIKVKFNLNLPKHYSLLRNGFVNRFDSNPSICPVIQKMKQYCKVGLLTNMYLNMYKSIKNRAILPDISWDIIIDSSKIGLQKPDPKIFAFAEKKSKVHGQEILFVENSSGHVKAASKLGWNTFLYDSSHPEESSRKLIEYFSSLIKHNVNKQ